MTQWITDVDAIFAKTFTLLAAYRVANSLPVAECLVGRQYVNFEGAAPRIVVVPVGTTYEAFRPASNDASAPDYGIGTIPLRKGLFTRWMTFDAYFWGEPDPQFLQSPTSKLGTQNYQLNTTVELEREFFAALQQSVTIPTGHPVSGEWNYETVNTTYGASLVVRFRVATPLLWEEYTILPYAPVSGGVTIETSITIGSSTVGPIIIPGDS